MSPALVKLNLLLLVFSSASVLLTLPSQQDGRFIAAPTEDAPHVTLDDLASDAVALLSEADGVNLVERLVSVKRPTRRIIHVTDWHTVPKAFYAADLRDLSEEPLTDEEIKTAYAFSDAVTKIVQMSQRKLLHWMGAYYGVRSVYVEGVTDHSLPAYLTLVRSIGKRGADMLPPDFGAAAQAWIAGDIEELRAAEDEIASERAKAEAVGHLVFDGPANDAREAAIVKRLLAGGPLAVIVLGGDHDLSPHIRKIPDCEYLRVFVDGYPRDR